MEQVVFSRWLPFWTFLKREVLRVMSVATQTLLAPLVSASLYLLVFGVSLGERISLVQGVSYAEFIVPGLIMMGVINNSFANSSSSLFMARYLGFIVDILVTPLSSTEFILGYTLSSMLRGALVGLGIFSVSFVFVELPWAHPLFALLMLLLASFLFAQFGILVALVSNSFDTMSVFTNFLLLPLIYLGGLFYPVTHLPGIWAQISLFNPLFYIIDGFRHALLGTGEVSFFLSFSVTGALSLVVFFVTTSAVRRGVGLQS
ncbi:ABC transporter permease [bacterium]|nr:ABC transporter permease [bacterium]